MGVNHVPKTLRISSFVGLVVGLLMVSASQAQSVTNEIVASGPAASQTEVDQWKDFPSGRTIQFSGYSWRVKGNGSTRKYGPGGYPFGTSEKSVWVDEQGRLHLRVTKIDEVWHSAEVRLTKPLGYGDYRFTTIGRVDDLDPNLVFGLFLWEYQASYEESNARNVANEFDVEFGTWKDPKRAPAQFVCQPWHHQNSLHPYRFTLTDKDQASTHAFRWLADRVECRAWRGGAKNEGVAAQQLTRWAYKGLNVPKGAPQVHLNFWCIEEPPARGTPQEVVIERFEFIPAQR